MGLHVLGLPDEKKVLAVDAEPTNIIENPADFGVVGDANCALWTFKKLGRVAVKRRQTVKGIPSGGERLDDDCRSSRSIPQSYAHLI